MRRKLYLQRTVKRLTYIFMSILLSSSITGIKHPNIVKLCSTYDIYINIHIIRENWQLGGAQQENQVYHAYSIDKINKFIFRRPPSKGLISNSYHIFLKKMVWHIIT